MSWREVCCTIVTAVGFKLLFVFCIFQFGVVGATLGSIGGGVIGWMSNNRSRLMESVIIGAVSATSLSYKLVKATFDHLHADDDDDDADEHVFLVHVVKLIAGDLIKAPFGKAYSLADFIQSSLKHHDSSSY